MCDTGLSAGFVVAVVLNVLFCLTPCAVAQHNDNWKIYDEPSGAFRVEYPPQWHILQEGNGRLDILSFPKEQSAHGAVLIRHGAEIQVLSAPESIHSVREWMNQEVTGESNVIQEQVPAAVKANRTCTFTAVSYENEFGPNTWTTNKVYFGECGRRLLRIRLTFFKPESNERFLKVLDRMAASLLP
jgi:hypothetical protein